MNKEIKFVKMSGGGNDFIVIDNRKKILPVDPGKFALKVCQRKISVGADGLLLVEKSNYAKFKMRIFNPDGSEAEMCGNGSRCIARFCFLKGISPARMTFETKAGLIRARILDKRVKLKMSDPTDFRFNLTIKIGAKTLTGFYVNTGVPHTVIFTRDIEKVDVFNLGRKIRNHTLFKPAGTNVDFVKEEDSHTIMIRTYERGVEEETLACGTGAVASAIVSAMKKKVASPVKVIPRGGEVLKVYFNLLEGKISDVSLEGEACLVYEGTLHLNSVMGDA